MPWDAAAVFTYFTISLLFWYLGVIPDLAAVRDRTPRGWQKVVYGIFALGWRGAASHLRHYRVSYGLLAGLAAPLVLSVHSVVSSDFAIAQLPGWHSTIFPPYFVAGAIFSGFAMVLTLMVPIRRIFGFHNVVTDDHIDNVGKMILVTGWIVDYSYFCEFFLAWWGGERIEMFTMFHALPGGPHAWVFWLTMFCNVVVTQAFWFRRVRRNVKLAWVLSLLINVGMWSERFVVIVLSLQRGHLPSMWHAYSPTVVDWGILGGTLGFFFLLFVLFLRWVPVIPASEVRELNRELREEHASDDEGAGVKDPRGQPIGVLGEYKDPRTLLKAITELRARGYRLLDAFVPYPVKGLEEALALKRSRLNYLNWSAGAIGAAFAFWLQWLVNHRLFPLNIGGRPSFAIPAFIIVTFETMVLFAGVTAFVGLIWVCRLPRLAHPLFRVEGFESATLDGFWLGVSIEDREFDPERTEDHLRELGAARVELAWERR